MKLKEIINYLFTRFYQKGIPDYQFHKEKAYSDRGDFLEWQLDTLNQVINHACQEIPYYHNALRGQQIKLTNLSQIETIPILEKATIRQEKDDLYHRDHNKQGSYLNTSGGSTGEPLQILQDAQYAKSSAGLFAFIKETRTGNPFCSLVSLWGATRDLYGDKNSLKGRLANLLNNSKQFNSARLTPKDIIHFIDSINKQPPALIVAYAQSVFEVARFAEENNISIKPQNAVHTGAGKLFPYMREKIQKVFGAEVFDHYGSREVGAVATECKAHDGLHLLESFVYVEVVNEQGKACEPGEEGDVLVTTLHNRSMPLIRFRIGDRAIRKPATNCSCGINYAKLTKISGRTSNNFLRKDGGFVSGEYLTLTFNHVEGVESFQIRQKNIGIIVVYLVVNECYDLGLEEKVTAKFRKLFDEPLKVSYYYVEEIPRTPTGKHLFTVSELI